MRYGENIFRVLAITTVVASIVVSCSGKLKVAEPLDLTKTPLQTVEDMFAVQTQNGRITQRVEANKMETYDSDTAKIELFPDGLSVFSYTTEGELETVMVSDVARHVTSKKRQGNDIWEAYGQVVIHNITKQQTMETDTLFWDRTLKEIYTDCYVKMYSPDGFMQGYGLRSDERARNAVLNRPFNNYTVVEKDTTAVIIDSVNFIGPFPKK